MNASTPNNTNANHRARLLAATSRAVPRLVFAEDFAEDEQVEFLIDELVPKEGLLLGYGGPGAGKSFLFLEMALHVAHGLPFFGREVRQGLVIYVAGEGQAGVKMRVNAWHRVKGLSREDLAFAMWPHAVDLCNEDAVEAFIQNLRATKERRGENIAMVVFDTLSRCMPGADENLQRDMSKAIDSMAAIQAEFGCLTLAVHHTPKSGQNPRGSNVATGAADTQLFITKTDYGVAVEVQKQKDGEDGQVFAAEFETVIVGHDRKGRPKKTRILRNFGDGISDTIANDNQPTGKNQAAAFEIIKAVGPAGISEEELRAEFQARGIGGKRSSAFAETIKALADKRLITRRDDRFFATA